MHLLVESKINLKVILLFNLLHQLESFNTMFDASQGSWCPYQIDKYVSCQVPNGTDTYFGSPICWKSLNGSFSCTKRLIRRPRFVTTYKKVKETRYKCCPAYYGVDCNLECLNCTSFQVLVSKVKKLEADMLNLNAKNTNYHRVKSTLEKSAQPDPRGLQYDSDEERTSNNESNLDNSIDAEGLDDNDNHEHLENAISSLVSNMRDLDARLRLTEHKVTRMMVTVQDISMANIGLKSIIDNLIKEKNSGTRNSAVAENYYKMGDSESQEMEQKLHANYTAIRILESNLARGDIASTLNDDYGEDNSSSTISPEDEYVDPFHLDEDEDDDDDGHGQVADRERDIEDFEENDVY